MPFEGPEESFFPQHPRLSQLSYILEAAPLIPLSR